ncbi:NUDIX domain-containing protein [Bacillus toyonensis]|uniref:NUDIX domain-containing protein n=1 Tax=Bacillus toyonensis TaxID=155322 RepID=UPI002E1E4820|nr:NUDIX domain-containing protein [Bacillus toyonensis]MED2737151.1 NUDIX domain-containing protein [Bacillus toyonensis]
MTNKEALQQYDVKKYRTPDGYTSDIAVFTFRTDRTEQHKPPVMSLMLMLIKRAELNQEGKKNIEAGKWALPGGFVDEKESAFEAAVRELEEETGVNGIHIKQYGIYDKPGRDPRGWIISNAHYAIVQESDLHKRKANDDAAEVELFSIDEVFKLDLAFDHEQIIRDAINQITKDLLQTTIGKLFIPEQFTYSELQALLLTVTDHPAIKQKEFFARKIKTLPFIAEVPGEKTSRTSKQPTQLYQFVEYDIFNSIYIAKF